jgi:hypothetical protein
MCRPPVAVSTTRIDIIIDCIKIRIAESSFVQDEYIVSLVLTPFMARAP